MTYKEDLVNIISTFAPEEAADKILEDFRLLSRKNTRIEMAPQKESEELPRWIEVNFMVRVLGIERWMITDMSSITDFWPSYDIECIDGFGKEPGTYLFESRYEKSDGSTEVKEVEECKPKRFREKIIIGCMSVFGVNPCNFINDEIYKLFTHILEEIPEDRAKKCIAWFEEDLKKT